ncbi:hypothetical protein NQZ68_040403 [Dissostichus eleginoides]|nr:hypothetical protein NQZ68_040403 [Dissostichus eleginoides]
MLGGCGILGVGVWLSVTQGNFATLSSSLPSLSAANLLIAVGTIIMVIGCLGCVGAVKESRPVLLTPVLHEDQKGLVSLQISEPISMLIADERHRALRRRWMKGAFLQDTERYVMGYIEGASVEESSAKRDLVGQLTACSMPFFILLLLIFFLEILSIMLFFIYQDERNPLFSL